MQQPTAILSNAVPVLPKLETHPMQVAKVQGAPLVPAKPTQSVQDEAARERLVMENLAMVRFIARKIHQRVPQHVELDDLVASGMLGLVDAAAKFDFGKGVQFKSYAQVRVRGAVLDSMRREDWSPRELRRKARAMAEAIRSLSARIGRTPADEEIADEMEMSLGQFHRMTGELKGLEVESLNEERGEDGTEEKMDAVAAPEGESPLALLLSEERKTRLADALLELPERERLVLQLHLVEGLTMKEIGLTLGVVESRISQIKAAAVTHLRRILCRKGYKSPQA